MARTALLLIFLIAATLHGQEPTVEIRISTAPTGGVFSVDGVLYDRPTTFVWPVYSLHSLEVEPSQRIAGDMRYDFLRWTDSSGAINTATAALTLHAVPTITDVVAHFGAGKFLLTLRFFNCYTILEAVCPQPGTVTVNDTVYFRDAFIWILPGTPVRVKAQASNGFYFEGWGNQLPVYGSEPEQTFTLEGPVYLNPKFVPASNVHLRSQPNGLNVMADGILHKAPVWLQWEPGTRHTISAVAQQKDAAGNGWVFDSWADGGPLTREVSLPKDPVSQTYLARFIPGAMVSLATEPDRLKLEVDGSTEDWAVYNLIWGIGTTHTVSAPLQQVDGSGRAWVFERWSNGGLSSQTVRVPEGAGQTGVRLTAIYAPYGRVRVVTIPAGIEVELDGKTCRAPCSVEGPIGEKVKIAVPGTFQEGPDTRVEFVSWSGGPQRDSEAVLRAELITITARYVRRHRLRMTVVPEGAGTLRFEPNSPEGFVPENEPVRVYVDTKPGYRFHRWEGIVSDAFYPGVLTVSRPEILTAVLKRGGPTPESVTVLNGAGATPSYIVAPGSIISIYGEEIAQELTVAHSNPLPQALGGTSVRVNGSLLGLMFVSPTQINAQLPWQLEPGEYQLEVMRQGNNRLTGEIQVAEYAPGVFTWKRDEDSWPLAFHPDGALITPERPAHAGEVVRIYATGLGPLMRPLPDGFAAPEEPLAGVKELPYIKMGDLRIASPAAHAVPGYTGLMELEFRMPEVLPGGSKMSLSVVTAKSESNAVELPVQ